MALSASRESAEAKLLANGGQYSTSILVPWYVLMSELKCSWIQVCKIVEGQRYSKRLNERQITALLKVTCQRPQEREYDILQVCLIENFCICLFNVLCWCKIQYP